MRSLRRARRLLLLGAISLTASASDCHQDNPTAPPEGVPPEEEHHLCQVFEQNDAWNRASIRLRHDEPRKCPTPINGTTRIDYSHTLFASGWNVPRYGLNRIEIYSSFEEVFKDAADSFWDEYDWTTYEMYSPMYISYLPSTYQPEPWVMYDDVWSKAKTTYYGDALSKYRISYEWQ